MFLNLTGFEFFLDTDLILKLPQRGQPFYSPESRAQSRRVESCLSQIQVVGSLYILQVCV